MVEATATAFGSALAEAKVATLDGETECTAVVFVTAGAKPGEETTSTCTGDCVKRGRKCARRESDAGSVKGCCNAEDVCVQETRRYARCRPKSSIAEDAAIRTCCA